MKRIHSLILILIFPFLLTGCWDYRDINNRCVTLSVGIDTINEEIQFTGEIANFKTESKEATKSITTYKMLSYGKDFEEARVQYDAVNPYPVFLGATRVVAFSTKYARQSIEPYLHRINKFYDYRKTLLTVVTREAPEEIFNIKVDKDVCVGYLIEDIVQNLKIKGQIACNDFSEIMANISLENVGYILPYIGKEKNNIKYLGLAIMKDSKLIDIVDVRETNGLLYILAQNALLTEALQGIDNKENIFSFRSKINNRKISIDYVNEKPVINIYLDLSEDLEFQYIPESVDKGKQKILERKIEESIKAAVTRIVIKSQNEWNCDIFGFARYFNAKYPKIYKESDWKKLYSQCSINVSVKAEIANLPMSIKKSQSKK